MNELNDKTGLHAKLLNILWISAILVVLFIARSYSYLLFHSLVELSTISIALAIFFLIWNTRDLNKNDFIKIISIGYAASACIDLIHTLAFKGMNIFIGYDANLPTQLWIAARYIQALTLVAAPLALKRNLRLTPIITCYAVITTLLMATIFSGAFPDCYREGSGLTTFKIVSEYLIVALFIVSIILLHRAREFFNDTTFRLLIASSVFAIFTELAFASYIGVYDYANMVGHIFKLATFYLIYRALFVIGIKEPFSLMFKDLKQSEESLKHSLSLANATLESTNDGILIVDLNGKIIRWNQKFADLWQIPKELLSQNRDELLINHILHQLAEPDKFIPKINELYEHPEKSSVDLLNFTDGRIFDRYSQPQRLGDDVVGRVWSFRDITKRKLSEEQLLKQFEEIQVFKTELEMQNDELLRSQEKLETSRARYSSLYDFAPVGYLTIDENGMITEANLTATTMLGVARTLLINRPKTQFIFREDQDVYYLHRKKIFATGMLQSWEMRMVRADGSHFWAHLQGVDSHEGEYWIAFIDITRRKDAEDALKEANQRLEIRVLERTAELNISLVRIKKVSLEMSWAEERERERIAGELHDQVGQSLLLAKMKLDALPEKIKSDSLHKYAGDISSLLQTSIHDIRALTFRMRPPFLETSGIDASLEWLCSSISRDYPLRIDFEDDESPKPLPLEVGYSLYQAVRELLLNIVKHAGVENAQLSVRTDNKMLMIRVKDNGVGFNLSDLGLTGLNNFSYGLYNVQQRIENIGGKFAVESEPGKGTTVTLMVPLDEG